MSCLRNFRCWLIILLLVISAENLRSEDNVTTRELPVSSTSFPTVCISSLDIIPANVKGEATIAFPEEVREIKVTLKKQITSDSNGVALGLIPVGKEANTTPLSLLTTALTANTTTVSASADFDASTPIDPFSFKHRSDLCIRNGSYCYLSSEIRWGNTNESGFDHTVAGRSSLEIQHFFWNSSFESLALLGIAVRYRIIKDHEVNARVYDGKEMTDYLRNIRVDDALMRRKREASDGKVVPGDPATRSDGMSRVKSVNSTERESFVTNVHKNDITLTATSNVSHFGSSEYLALNLSSKKTLRENHRELSYISHEEFKAFLKGDLQEINVTLGDFLLPPGEGYYQYRGNYVGDCDIKVDWLLYVKEDLVLPSVLKLFRQMYSPSNTSELQQTSHHQMQRSVDVFRWPYPDPSGVESSGSRLRYFNPIVFLAIPILLLLAFFIL